MSKPMEEKEPAFKVVDRRRFDEEGREKEAHADEPKVEPKVEPKKEQAQAESQKTSREAMPMSFSLFIQTLAHQAMMGLGLVPWPDSGLVKQDKVLAKETIDLLQMLKSKTQNNLDKDEQALLDGMLYQLHVAYVEIFK